MRVRAAVDAETVAAQTSNVIGEAQGGSADSVVIVGAHLDSVAAGPGINDNGSGTAAILEIAIQLARLGITTPNRLRFAFWGAEEWGLLGSTHYVEQLTSEELGRIVLNLNYDMLGSPNPVSFVYDGDGSDDRPGRPAGLGGDRGGVCRVLPGQQPADPSERFRRPLGLWPVHRPGHSRRRAVLGGGSAEDRRARRRISAARPASPTTSAIIRPATISPMSTRPRCTRSATRRRMRCCISRPNCRFRW